MSRVSSFSCSPLSFDDVASPESSPPSLNFEPTASVSAQHKGEVSLYLQLVSSLTGLYLVASLPNYVKISTDGLVKLTPKAAF